MSATIGVVPQTPKKPVHSFRVEDAIWNEAVRVATTRQESLSDVLRKALERYIKQNKNLPSDDEVQN